MPIAMKSLLPLCLALVVSCRDASVSPVAQNASRLRVVGELIALQIRSSGEKPTTVLDLEGYAAENRYLDPRSEIGYDWLYFSEGFTMQDGIEIVAASPCVITSGGQSIRLVLLPTGVVETVSAEAFEPGADKRNGSAE